MRVLVAASGDQSKWGNHLGVPSHLAPVGGRPLLARTVDQVLAHTGDVHVTVPPGDERYTAAASGAVAHERGPGMASEYAATRDLWSTEGRTVLLLGDVYFTDAATTQILTCRRRMFRVFGRRRGSRLTGCGHGEIFAVSWWPAHHAQMDEHLGLVHSMRASGAITRPPGWMLLRAWQDTPLEQHRVRAQYFETIDDLTDDFDYPSDYDRHPAVGRPQ
ncbi:hypothetical protein [Streptomonospora arabica]|uniref:MobA-like NTP transferase domain-containing protein n=1 Tax=Streptomonospora arabica TaxID=412417 RepID=A0ABV9SSJ7_9ACTN